MINTEWDKSNIGENYPGKTLPLTYSFILDAYKNVYKSFLQILKIRQSKIYEYDSILSNMLGYINGEVFYNINSWYSFLKIFPGYKYNKEFFENMLNPLKNKDYTPSKKSFINLIRDLPKIINLINSIVFIKKHYQIFDKSFEDINKYYKQINLKTLSVKQLTYEFFLIEEKFFKAWGHTIVNDFRVMVFFGLYTKFLKKIHNNNNFIFSNHIRLVSKRPQSAKVLDLLIEIAIKVKNNNINLSSIDKLKKDDKEIYTLVNDYLNKYGERSFNELKLEESNFNDNPNYLLSLIKYYAQLPLQSLKNFLYFSNKDQCDLNFIENLNFIEKLIYNSLKKISVQSINKREEFRLKRAKAFKIAKEFFLEMSRRMKKEGLIVNQSDIFYLYKDEIINTLNNHRIKDNFDSIVSFRKLTIQNYKKQILDRRITTYDIFCIKKDIDTNNVENSLVLTSRVTSFGNFTNCNIVLMHEIDINIDVKGKVLVTRSTDPGWTVLFPLLKGIIIEEGGLLSHASIVAREFGIPCVILPNALKIFKETDILSLNGSTGEITKL